MQVGISGLPGHPVSCPNQLPNVQNRVLARHVSDRRAKFDL
jgi:hypothetical protein